MSGAFRVSRVVAPIRATAWMRAAGRGPGRASPWRGKITVTHLPFHPVEPRQKGGDGGDGGTPPPRP